MDKKAQVLEKIKQLNDLRDAIKMVKNLQVKKAENVETKSIPQDESQKGPADMVHTLRHLGVKEIQPGITTHIIGSSHPEMASYHADVDLNAMHKKHPHVSVSCVDRSGMVLSKCSKVHANMKDAVKSIINHLHKGSWE